MAPFVYTKKTHGKRDPCHDFTCDIQACLAKNDYRQERCEHLVDRLYDCCRRHYAKHDDQIASCPDPHVLRDKMAARESAAGKTTSQQ